VASALEYSSGSFADFIADDGPDMAGTGAAGADLASAPGTGDHEPTGDGADLPGTGTGGGDAGDVQPEVPVPARPASGNGSSGPSTRPMDAAPLVGLAADTGGVTSTKPMNLGPRLVFPEPWRDAHADVLASLPPYLHQAASLPPASPRRGRTLMIALALVVLAGGGTAAALTLLGHHSPVPQAALAPQASGSPAGSAPASPGASTASARPSPGLAVRASGWTAPVPIDQTGLEASNAIITGLSCPQVTACYAVDSAGNVLSSTSPSASTRGTWHVVAKDPNGLVAISCPTTSSCLAVDKAGDVITLSNGAWSSPVYVDDRSGVFTAVSCPEVTFCMAADSGGNAFAYTAASGTWQPFTVDTSGGGLTGVSCTGPDSCVAVDTGGGAYTYDGSSWSAAVPVDVGQAFTAVSCASPSFCAATDDGGKGAILAGGTWSVAGMGTSADALSCPADGFCLATDGSGGAVVYQDGAWSTVTRIDGQQAIDTLSCPARNACTGMDRRDNVLYYAPRSAG
jgi:hypothetical protein